MGAVVLTMVLLVVSACTFSQREIEDPGWTTIALPDALPRTLAVDGNRVLVAGERGRYAPAAWIVGRSVTTVVLRPHSPYGPTADLVAATLSGDTVAFAGQRPGGAHGIPRWTIWAGTVSGGADDLPQTFETFGGPDSLGLVGLQTVAGKPLLLGNWADGQPGPAFWRASGTRWARVPSTLAGFLASGMGVSRGRPVVVGHSTTGGSLRPTVWLGAPDLRSWRALPLGNAPVARALDLSCAGPTCLVVVRTPGTGVAVWEVGGTARELPTPKMARDAEWAQVSAGPDGGRAVAFGSSERSVFCYWKADGWRYAVPPVGVVRDLATVGNRFVAIVGDGEQESSPRALVTT
ncbi:hypothetical protein CryarDRAFT_0242 [Cryptosporangium arvum DSM 44712]|uniref:Uncharacterized protein n=2 Tax=Cryptosporangium TaxID=65502 RepID=A0A010ZKN8_9ACTN|nr:hypothetical protein CryarDRAFT_0242 [Cryptosporangium arvum DSM 44712]